jgi:hypothetical protein
MGEQSATRLKGDDFQHLYSWFELLSLLNPDSPYDYGYVEHPAAGAADDITLHSDRESVPAKYTQVKYHMDQRSQYSATSLVDLSPGSARSLLHKLYDSWRKLSRAGEVEVEIWLVSNWPSAVDFGKFIHDTCSLTKDFFDLGPRSDAGTIRRRWREELAIEEMELQKFCRALRFRLGFGGIGELEEAVNDRMVRYGLRAGQDAQAIARDVVRGWIKEGGKSKRIDRAVLEATVRDRCLKAVVPQQPKVSLWVHGWAKRFYDLPPTIELNWTKFFDIETRKIADQTTWDTILIPQLKQAREQLSNTPSGDYIDLRAKVPLSASVMIGRIFAEAMGFKFRVEQPSGGEIHLWRSDAGAGAFSLRATSAEGSAESRIGLVSVSITGDAKPDIQRQFAKDQRGFRRWVDLQPESGPRATSLSSANEAVAVAHHVKETIRELRSLCGLEQVWLFLYCPATLAVFIGQRLNAVGAVVLYERDGKGNYAESAFIETG